MSPCGHIGHSSYLLYNVISKQKIANSVVRTQNLEYPIKPIKPFSKEKTMSSYALNDKIALFIIRMKTSGRSQKELAEDMGVSEPYITRLKDKTIPSSAHLDILIQRLHVSKDEAEELRGLRKAAIEQKFKKREKRVIVSRRIKELELQAEEYRQTIEFQNSRIEALERYVDIHTKEFGEVVDFISRVVQMSKDWEECHSRSPK